MRIYVLLVGLKCQLSVRILRAQDDVRHVNFECLNWQMAKHMCVNIDSPGTSSAYGMVRHLISTIRAGRRKARRAGKWNRQVFVLKLLYLHCLGALGAQTASGNQPQHIGI